MTIAIGMLCEDGLILAADTRISYDGGPVSNAIKLKTFEAGEGVYAIAHSSNDVNAADSLIAELKAEITGNPPDSLVAFVKRTQEIMNNWCLAAHETRPVLHLLIILFIRQEWGFYFCEPPNTVTFIHEKYKAIGDGWMYTDPIYKTWFDNGPLVSPHAALCQASYMMHKAKQLLPATIGGDTDVAVLMKDFPKSCLTRRLDMATAESYGLSFDRTMSYLSSLVMSGNTGGTETILKTAESIYQCGLNYSRLEFHCQFPERTIRH